MQFLQSNNRIATGWLTCGQEETGLTKVINLMYNFVTLKIPPVVMAQSLINNAKLFH